MTNGESSKANLGPTYSFGGYQIKIRTTQAPLLLVEGKDDFYFFDKLLHNATKSDNNKSLEPLQIDTANMLQDERLYGLGNREKIEAVCKEAAPALAEDKQFCGFVDREFRGFKLEQVIKDPIESHYVEKSLVWSRGHSIENYYFDVYSLSKSFELASYINSSRLQAALNLFKKSFHSAFRVSCAVSLAAKDSELLSEAKRGIIKRCIFWKNFLISDYLVNIDINEWRKNIIKVGGDEKEIFFEKYQYWYDKLKDVDISLLRWLCHGHIGFTTLWAIYIRCVYEAKDINESEDERQKVANQILKIGEDMRFHFCNVTWLENIPRGTAFYPEVVLKKLGYQIQEQTSYSEE